MEISNPGHRRLHATVTLLAAVLIFNSISNAIHSTALLSKPSLRGGTLDVLALTPLDSWTSLDPAVTPGLKAYSFYPDAIYGELFQLSSKGRLIPDLATGYSISADARKARIDLRRGVTFSDGTPFNAAAVKFNINRDIASAACNCAPQLPIASIATPNSHTVVLNLNQPDGAIIDAFVNDAPNWIVSPTAVKKEGQKQIGVMPVGAGPFIVKQNIVGSKLVLTRNPHYWAKGKPYLDSLTFRLVGSDQTAYEAVQAGTAQAYLLLSTTTLAKQIRKSGKVGVVPVEGRGVDGIQLNTTKPPFNNILAREAVSYATDPSVINEKLFSGTGTVVQSPSSPDSLFYEAKVPGYHGYNLNRAKALVRQLGGLKVTLLDDQSPVTDQIMTAVGAQWSQAGIQTTLDPEPLTAYIQKGNTVSWEASIGGMGSFDPAVGTAGIAFRFASNGSFSGVRDPALDELIAKGAASASVKSRVKAYQRVYKRMAQKAYGVMLTTVPAFNIAAHTVSGPGFTSPGAEVFWEDVSVAP